MCEEKIVGSLEATKPPNTFITETGAVKKEEEEAYRCILLFTSKRLIIARIAGESRGLTDILVDTLPIGVADIVGWLKDYGKRILTERGKRTKTNEATSVDDVLSAIDHFEVDYMYIEKVRFKKSFIDRILFSLPNLEIKISWNPTLLDKELTFFINRKHKYEDCLDLLCSALLKNLSSTL